MNLYSFIKNTSFPCIMARAVAQSGHLDELKLNTLHDQQSFTQLEERLHQFIDHYRNNQHILHSFVLSIGDRTYIDFDFFEKKFWSLLKSLQDNDKKFYQHDPRVSSDPMSPNYSYSLKEESFFILALHPNSPRFSRRFTLPSIVFNPHQQFEELRQRGIYKKIRDTIRKRDKNLQGSINPMLSDFGEDSEIYQYMGRSYQREEKINHLM